MMTMRMHDERWWKCGGCQRLCGHDMQPWALKPSHTVKACVLSNHVKFRCIQAHIKGISTLVPFTSQCATSVDNGIGDGLVIGRRSMTFQESFDKDSLDGNGKWWQWDYMMNVNEKHGLSKRLCGHDMHPWALKPSHNVKECVLSNHVKFRRI